MRLATLIDDIRHNFVGEAFSVSEIFIILNRVIASLDIKFKGVEVVVDVSSSIVSEALEIPSNVNKIQSIFLDDEKLTNVSREVFLDDSQNKYIYNVVGNKVYFNGVTDTDEVKLLANINLTKFDSSTTVDDTYEELELPDSVYDVLFYGALFGIVQRPKHKNKELLNEYRYKYNEAIKDFRYVVENREPMKHIAQEWTW